MSASPHGRLARAASWFVEPAPAPLVVERPPSSPPLQAVVAPRPLVAVCGIRSGCGATTVARALAAQLAARDPLRSAVVAGREARGALPLGTPAAARLARLVSDRAGIQARPSGRLCLAQEADPRALERALRGAASLVLDVELRHEAPAASLADHVVLVAGPATEPALAEIVAASLGRIGPPPIVVLNRAPSEPASPGTAAERLAAAPGTAWSGRAHVAVPSSASAARLALACRGGGGAFGAAIVALADLCGRA